MWISLTDEAGNCVADPINISRTTDFVKLNILNGQLANDCLTTLEVSIDYFQSTNKSSADKIIISDAKRHLKKAFARKTNNGDRLAIIFKAWDILWGQEDFWVPSTRNTVLLLQKIVSIFEKNKTDIVNVR